MKHTIVRCICVGLLGLLALPGPAAAQSEAYTNAPAILRAGPAPDYPLVAELPAGTLVSVIGCLEDYTWCDVAVPGVRGWINAGRLTYAYQGDYYVVRDYGGWIGYPVVVFDIVVYWNTFFFDRPFFHNRDHFMHMHHRAEARLGPGGIPPGIGHPQIGQAPGAAIGGQALGRGHDARPSMPSGGMNGGVRTPGPQGSPGGLPMPHGSAGMVPLQGGMATPAPQAGGAMHAPGPQAGGAMHAPGPPAGGVVHAPSATMGGGAVMMPLPSHQGGGGAGDHGFSRQGGGGGTGGGDRGMGGTEFRR